MMKRMTPLAELRSWPPANIAAALIDASDAGDGSGAILGSYGDGSRVFPLASVTKLLTSYAFLIAVEEGVFELDTAVRIPDGATASIRQLLSHASGVGFSRSDRIKPPGQRRIYSSYGFEILADLLVKESDIPLPVYLQEAVCQPLGMTRTVLAGSAGHGASSTVADLARFAVELVRPRLLSAEMSDAYARIQYPELIGVVPGYGMQKPCPWGLGCEVKGNKSPHWTGSTMPADTFGHFGMTGTFLWVHRPSGRATVVLTDKDFGDWARYAWGRWNTTVWENWPKVDEPRQKVNL